MAYISQYSGETLDENIAINSTQNNRLTTIENKLNTVEEGANKFVLTNNCIQTTHVKDEAITAEKLAPEVAEALASIKTYQATLFINNWIDDLSESEDYSSMANKWKWEKFPASSSALTSSIRDTLKAATPTDIKYFNDTEITSSFDFGENYVARCTTYIYCNQSIDLSFTFQTDDDSCAYLNGQFIRNNPNTTATSMTLSFEKGINILEIIYREMTGKDGWMLTPSISSHLGGSFKAMYAVPAHTYYQIVTPICLDGSSKISSNTIFSPGMLLNGNIPNASLRDRLNSGYVVGNNDGTIKVVYNHTIPIDTDITMYWFGKTIE